MNKRTNWVWNSPYNEIPVSSQHITIELLKRWLYCCKLKLGNWCNRINFTPM